MLQKIISLLLSVGAAVILTGGVETQIASSPVPLISESSIPIVMPDRLENPEIHYVPNYDVPLEYEVQEYIWKMCQENSISYELVLALIQAESSFKIDVVSKTNDHGLMQLNATNTMDWLADKVGISEFDPLDPYHNVSAGIWYLLYLRDYWDQYGLGQENAIVWILLSYNRGITGAKNYAAAGNVPIQDMYVQKVLGYKYELEEQERR